MRVEWDEEGVREFLAGPYLRVLHTVRLAADSGAEAEDAVHEAMARAWERRTAIEHPERWILTVALNLTRSRWRQLLRTPRRALTAPPAQDDIVTREWLMVLRALPRRQREVAVLHYVDDLAIAEIADIVGTSEGAVKNALHHARRSLAAALDETPMEERTP
jgi:RNA polymerase sigma-70 factor (ECF subfamily)